VGRGNVRKNSLVVNEVHHVFNKSIAEFKIFNNDSYFSRMTNVIRYYQREKPEVKFSDFIRSAKVKQKEEHYHIDDTFSKKDKLVEIIAYCIMPTHIHLILKQLKEKGISIFMNNILNSYTRYFNTRHKRKGPLWEGRFKSVLVESDEQLLHLTRYIHLNPVTAHLVERPEEWSFCSYKNYLLEVNKRDNICKFDDIMEIEPGSYRKFVEDRISYQRELAAIKNLLIEENQFPTYAVGKG